MTVSDPLVMPLARELLECVRQEVAKTLSPPVYVGLRPGVVVDHLTSTTADECCEGLAWVRPDTHYPCSGTFPDQDGEPAAGGAGPWCVVLEMGAVRCAPTPDATSIPSAAEWEAVVQAVMDDAAALRRAACCFLEAVPGRSRSTLVGAWLPLAVQGGCVGGVLTLTVRGPECDCVDAGPES